MSTKTTIPKRAEPIAEPMMTAAEAAAYDARTLQGLTEAVRGEGCSVEEFSEKMEARIAGHLT